MKRKYGFGLIVVLLIVALGCSLGGLVEGVQEAGEQAQELAEQAEELAGESGDGEATEEAIEEEATTEPESEASPEETADEEAPPEPVELDPDALEGLDSYRSKIVVRTESVDGTVEEMTIEAAATRDPAAQHFIITGAMEEEERMEIIQIGNQQWIQFGEDWMQTEADEEDALDFEENLFFSMEDIDQETLDDAKYLGKETVNGIRTRHYLIEETMWDALVPEEGEVEEAKADVWVADEADLPAFIVRMVVEVTGEGTDESDFKSYSMSMEVMDINADIIIEPPEGAESGGLPEDIPVYPNQQNRTSMGGMLNFETEDDFDTVVDFYTSEMEAAGWSTVEEENMSMETMVMQTWTKDDRSVELMISLDEETAVTSVTIILDEGE